MNPRTHAAAKDMEASHVPDWKLAYSIDEVCAATSWGETTVWRKLRTGDLRGKSDGRKVVILREELDRHLNALPDYVPAVLRAVK